MQPLVQPLSTQTAVQLSGLFLITEDGLGVASHVATLLKQQGAQVAILPDSSSGSLAQTLRNLQEQFGAVAGVVHLSALNLQTSQTYEQWRQETQSQVKRLFHLLQLSAADAPKVEKFRVAAASLFGGTFGRDGQFGSGLLTGGAHCGLLKTVGFEWPNAQVKAIDCDARMSPNAIAQQIVQELLSEDRNLEIGYPQGQRTVFLPVETPLPHLKTPQLQPQADWVVLVTGGSRGITAEVMKTFVVPGMTLIIVGRSPEPAPESPLTQDITDPTELRKRLLEQARAQGQTPTPVQIGKALQSLLHSRESAQNLQWFRQQGTVEYHAIDVKDPVAFGNLIDQLYERYGRLDAVIHGAGIIEDKLIADKPLDAFERVFDTKADSAFTLSQHLRPEFLKLLAWFCSVAGRFGNRGQSDYAAANEVVTRLAWQLDQQWPNTRVVALQWGPWDTTGMASEEVKRQFRDRGVIPIPITAGCQFFVDEILYGCKGDTEVIAGDGPWVLPALPESPASSSQPRRLPLLISQPELQPNSTITLQHTFSLQNDPYLGHHRLDGKPVLPAAGAAEWLAEFVQAAWSDRIVTEIRDLKMMQGLVLPSDDAEVPVLFRARASSHADSDSLQVVAEFLDAAGKRAHYRATVVLESRPPEPPLCSEVELAEGRYLTPKLAYDRYLFHGPHIQLLTNLDRLSELGIDAFCVPSSPTAWKAAKTHPGAWIFDPGLLDLGPQLATVWSREIHDTTALPTHFGRVVRYGQDPFGKTLRLWFRVKAHTPYNLTYDALFVDTQNRVRLWMQDIEGNCTQALNRLGDQFSV